MSKLQFPKIFYLCLNFEIFESKFLLFAFTVPVLITLILIRSNFTLIKKKLVFVRHKSRQHNGSKDIPAFVFNCDVISGRA